MIISPQTDISCAHQTITLVTSQVRQEMFDDMINNGILIEWLCLRAIDCAAGAFNQ